MKLSKEESYKQLLFRWLELWHSYPGEMLLPAHWSLQLSKLITKTALELKGEPMPPWAGPALEPGEVANPPSCQPPPGDSD